MDFEIAQDASLIMNVNGASANAAAGGLATEHEVADVRVPCDFCGRKFNPDVSLKHIPIC